MREPPPAGQVGAASAELAAPCGLGACLRLGGAWWPSERLRLAASLPLVASSDPVLALGSVSLEAGGRFAFGRDGASWAAVELGGSLPTGTSDTGTLDVRRFALAPWYFGEGAATLWLDAALGYGSRGQFASARLGLLQDLARTEVNAGQKAYATRVRIGLEGGAQLTPTWLFEVGALATAAIAPKADYLLFSDDDHNVLAGAAYQVFAGLRARGTRSELALHLRVPFWQERATGSPRPPSQGTFWIFVEAEGRLWF